MIEKFAYEIISLEKYASIKIENRDGLCAKTKGMVYTLGGRNIK